MQLKLDRIELPIFKGDLVEWNSFKDLFIILIHNNDQIDNTLKLHQLRSHLRGTAFDTIKGYQLIGANYAAAWEDLLKRYDRTDNIIQEYIKKFIEMPILGHQTNYQKFATTNGKIRLSTMQWKSSIIPLPNIQKIESW